MKQILCFSRYYFHSLVITWKRDINRNDILIVQLPPNSKTMSKSTDLLQYTTRFIKTAKWGFSKNVEWIFVNEKVCKSAWSEKLGNIYKSLLIIKRRAIAPSWFVLQDRLKGCSTAHIVKSKDMSLKVSKSFFVLVVRKHQSF